MHSVHKIILLQEYFIWKLVRYIDNYWTPKPVSENKKKKIFSVHTSCNEEKPEFKVKHIHINILKYFSFLELAQIHANKTEN